VCSGSPYRYLIDEALKEYADEYTYRRVTVEPPATRAAVPEPERV
jgi:hypothetical protein